MRQNELLKQQNQDLIDQNQQRQNQIKLEEQKIMEEIRNVEEDIHENKRLIQINKDFIENIEDEKENSKKDIVKDKNKALELKLEGAGFFGSKDYEKAIDFFEQSLGYVPDDDIDLITKLNSNIGICLMRLKRYEEAITYCTMAIDLNPKFIKAQINRAECNYQVKKFEPCLADYEDLLKKDPRFVNQAKYNQIKKEYEIEMESKKEEVMGQLKNIGNKLLGNFGLSLDNFKLNPNQEGGYSVAFEKS